MIPAKVLAAIVLSQFVRSRVGDDNPKSQCLWWEAGTTVVYEQNGDGSAETPGDTEFSATHQAFATWQAQFALCGSLALEEGARTTSRTASYVEGGPNHNVVLYRGRRCSPPLVPANHACWVDDNCGNVFDCWQFGAGAIAITTTSYSPRSAKVLDADVELNVPSYIFTTVDSPPCVSPNFHQGCVATDVQNTMTHEVGHLLGLGHSPNSNSTMFSRADQGETSKRVLDPDSRRFVCEVYPKGKLSRGCSEVAFDGELGKAAPGCAAAPGGLLGALGLLGLLRRRRA